MTTPVWQPGTLYPTGSLVVPSSSDAPAQSQVQNGGFELDDADWTGISGDWSISTTTPLIGAKKALFNGTSADSRIRSDTVVPVVPGQVITARASCNAFDAPTALSQNGGFVFIEWLDALNAVVGEKTSAQSPIQNTGWHTLTVTGTAPAAATQARVGLRAFALQGGKVAFDAVSWNYAYQGVPAGFIFKAVQPTTGTSAAAEPTWPTVLGNTVVDGTVTWEAIDIDRVVWEAHPILLSGTVEPTWPLNVGATVYDGTILWEAVALRIEDENCPRTKVTTIGASKVFKGGGDITPFCATNNPRDWTTPQDAGFLPTGLQRYGANDVAVLNLYRGNLVAMNSEAFQLWQIDPDPALMSIIDQMPAIGSTQNKAAQPVANDLLYLPALGVRSVGIAGASTNLSAGDVGMPIDPLVQAALAAAEAAGVEPLGMYFPAAGQYWLAFNTLREAEFQPLQDVVSATITESAGLTGTVSLVGSVLTGVDVSDDSPVPPFFTITLAGLTADAVIRVVPNNYNVVMNGAPYAGAAYFSTSLQTQSNTTAPVGDNVTAFTPESFTLNMAQASPVLNFRGTRYTFEEGIPVENFSFDLEIEVETVPASCTVFVYDMSGGGQGKWSRYVFPFNIDAWTLLGDDLVLRSGDSFVTVSEDALSDDVWNEVTEEWVETPFDGTIQTPWLDMGRANQDKTMMGFDIAGEGAASVSIGYNQANTAAFTEPLLLPADTPYEGMIPYEVTGPSFSVKLTYAGGQAWKLNAFGIYLQDRR